MDREQFFELLKKNEGVIVVKYGAEWCGPCKVLEPYLFEKKKGLPENAPFYNLDVDRDFDLFAHLKMKKQVTGVPVLLAYKKGNWTPFADECCTGTNKNNVDVFFNKINVMSKQL